MESRIFHETQRKIGLSFEEQKLKDRKFEYKKAIIDYQEFEDEISKLIRYTKNEWFMDNHYYSFFVFGETGNAKCCSYDTKVKIKISEDLYNELLSER